MAINIQMKVMLMMIFLNLMRRVAMKVQSTKDRQTFAILESLSLLKIAL